MKMPSIRNQKKLQAATARRSRALGLPDGVDYEQMSEPNMKLSRALLIVLVLHIVAVAGIIAFNTIKTRETMTADTPEAVPALAAAAPPAAAAIAPGKPATARPEEADEKSLLRPKRTSRKKRASLPSRQSKHQPYPIPARSTPWSKATTRSRSHAI